MRSRELGSESQGLVKTACSQPLGAEGGVTPVGRASASATGPAPRFDSRIQISSFAHISPNSSLANIDPFRLKLDHRQTSVALKLFSKFLVFCKTRQFDVSSSETGITPRVLALTELKLCQYAVPPIVLLIG